MPRPPFMLGLANKTGSKVWERRIKLHKLIEGHINRLKEEYNFTNPTVTGIFELQGVISQLSQDCINKRDQLMVRVCVSACILVCMCRREREGGAVGEKVEQLERRWSSLGETLHAFYRGESSSTTRILSI